MSRQVTLSVIIPTFNEENTITKLVKRVSDSLETINFNSEIFIVDDGSTDQTPALLKKLNISNLVIITHKSNLGKGAALTTGIKNSSGEIIIVQDADLEYHPKYFPSLLKPIIQKKTQIVFGSRLSTIPFTVANIANIKLPAHFIANKILSRLTSILYGVKISDMETGYKVFKKHVWKTISPTSPGFEIEVEFTAKAIKHGFKIVEIPIKTTPRDYAQGKKITYFDGLKALYSLLKYRITTN